MTSLQQSLSIADSHYFAVAIACSNFAAVAMTSLQQSLSIADNSHFTAAVAYSNYVVAIDMTSLQQPLLAATSPQ